MKYNNKSILLIGCMLIFLLIGTVSANEKQNETISNIDMENNVLIDSVNQSYDLNSQQNNVNQVNVLASDQKSSCNLNSHQNNIIDQSNNLNEPNLKLEVKIVSGFNNSSSNAKNFSDLQDLINDSPDNSVLDLNCDYNYTKLENFNGITINKNNFTIDGHNHILNANAENNSVRIFNVTGNNVVIKNLILVNAYVKDEGGAIYNTGKQLLVNNTTFVNNKAKNFAGAIYNLNATNVTINNSNFIYNTAGYAGGVIYNNYGANFTLNNSIFTNNTAAGNKGVIFNYKSNGFSIVNSTFTNNQAQLENKKYNPRNNYACKCGVIYNDEGNSFSIVNSTFTNKQANINDRYYNHCKCCAIFNSGNNFSIVTSTFIDNQAISGKYFKYSTGGAIYNCGNLTVFNSSFINNKPCSYSNAIYSNGYCIANDNWWNWNTPHVFWRIINSWWHSFYRTVIHNFLF